MFFNRLRLKSVLYLSIMTLKREVKNIMNQLNNDIKNRYELLTKLIKQIEKKMKNFPEGRISVKHHQNKDYYYLVDPKSGERYLHKEDIWIISLQ